jgi:uncharacterized protein (DUF2235 family)
MTDMPRNIVLCLDGTGNQVRADGNTNVLLLYQMLDVSDRDQQVAFYDPGVGTFASKGSWTRVGQRLTKGLGLVFGYGIKENLGQAYTFIMDHYRPGDRVFVFGFSRGAFTARALAGMSYRAGMMRRGSENVVSYLVSSYTRGGSWTDREWKEIDQFARTFSHDHDGSLAMPIHFLGLWDSVKALGYLRWDPKWPYTRQLPNARTIRHAVSINERRRPYVEYLVESTERSDMRETWFAGVHSDVGGTFTDDDRLSRITLKWMVDGALQRDIILRPRAYKRMCTLAPGDAAGTQHRMGRIWALATYRRRPIPAGAEVHASVRDRMATTDYALPTDEQSITWVDDDWSEPSPLAP